jgi:MFS family permease
MHHPIELSRVTLNPSTAPNAGEDSQQLRIWEFKSCILAVIVATLGAMQAGYHVAITSSIGTQVVQYTDVESSDWPTIVAMLQLGGAAGSLIEGALAYKIGAVTLIALSNIPIMIGCLSMLAFENYASYVASRICMILSFNEDDLMFVFICSDWSWEWNGNCHCLFVYI